MQKSCSSSSGAGRSIISKRFGRDREYYNRKNITIKCIKNKNRTKTKKKKKKKTKKNRTKKKNKKKKKKITTT